MEILSTIITSLALTTNPVPIVVDTQTATACIQKTCYPVLIGKTTPRGEYHLQLAKTDEAGYGGDVLVFKQDDTGAYAVHRIWTQRPSEKRLERIQQDTARRIITNGCINVDDETYNKLRRYSRLIIE